MARMRHVLELACSFVSATLAALTIAVPDWIEVVSGVQPDGGSGAGGGAARPTSAAGGPGLAGAALALVRDLGEHRAPAGAGGTGRRETGVLAGVGPGPGRVLGGVGALTWPGA